MARETITIEIAPVPANSPLLKQFSDPQPGNYCKIVLSDTGHGWAKHRLSGFFEPFFTTKEVAKARVLA